MNDPTSLQRRLGYSFLTAGINNQKIALYYLFKTCWAEGGEILLPRICNFDQNLTVKDSLPFADVFEIGAIRRFVRKYRLNLIEEPSEYPDVYEWEYFYNGARSLGQVVWERGDDVELFARDFFAALIPTVLRSSVWQTVRRNAFDGDFIDAVVQLRIEKDWQEYSERQQRPDMSPDDYNPTFQRILSKVRNSFPDGRTNLYVVCDEKALPASKDEIRQHGHAVHGLTLFWKSDFVTQQELDTLSVTDLSLLDFEMARESPCFIGLTRSTFSNMIALEGALRHGDRAKPSYIYNIPGDRIARRFDHGLRPEPLGAINPLQRAQPLLSKALISLKPQLCYWMVSHIATFGDLLAFDLSVGVRGFGRAIEGFQIETKSGPAIEYRARLTDGSWTDWISDGRFVGTRGRSQPLRGVSARLRPTDGEAFACRLYASFVGHPALVEAAEGDDCTIDGRHTLEAMQIVVTPLVGKAVVPFAGIRTDRVYGTADKHISDQYAAQQSSEAWNKLLGFDVPPPGSPPEQPERVSAVAPERKPWSFRGLFRL